MNATGKLHSRRGETLVEVLASVLICALAVLLLVSFATVSTRINKTAQDSDEAYYAALNDAEAHTGTPAPTPAAGGLWTVNVQTAAGALHPGYALVDVNFYGGDGVYSFGGTP